MIPTKNVKWNEVCGLFCTFALKYKITLTQEPKHQQKR